MEALIEPCELADVLPLVSKAASPKADTTLGMQTVQDACQRAQAMRVTVDGQVVCGYVVQPVQHDRGTVLWVKAAGGSLPGASLTRLCMPAIEEQARQYGARQVAITTKRKGLVAQLRAMGYEVTGLTLRKRLA